MNNICKMTSVLITWFTEQNLLTFVGSPSGPGLPARFLAQLHLTEPILFHPCLAGVFLGVFILLGTQAEKREAQRGRWFFFSPALVFSSSFWFLAKDVFPGLLTIGMWTHSEVPFPYFLPKVSLIL